MRTIDINLHDAVDVGDFEKVSELLSKGADANSIHTNGYTPLMHAVRAYKCTPEQRIQTAQILIDNGADLVYIAPDRYQTITLAHDIEVVSLCIDAGVKINQKLATELMYSFSGSIKIRNILKQLGISQIDWVDSERQLYNRICDYEGNNLFQDELEKAIPFLRNTIEGLSQYKKYDICNKSSFNEEDEYTLYALNRINEVLLLSFQKKRMQTDVTISTITLEQYIEFWQRLGLGIVDPLEYHPFFCEIYEVEECTMTSQQPEITKTNWPCLMFGDLLFSRAGVCIKASLGLIDKKTAESSTLYWSHWRYNRPTTDLSDGWGVNSQWRTRFRFDYLSDGVLYYNVNCDKGEDAIEDEDLSEEQRMELLKYRCFVSHSEVLDCFPYDYSATEKYQ